MPCCTPAEPMLVICRNGVGSGCVYGGGQDPDLARQLRDQHAPVRQELIAVGRSKPVARISFWK